MDHIRESAPLCCVEWAPERALDSLLTSRSLAMLVSSVSCRTVSQNASRATHRESAHCCERFLPTITSTHESGIDSGYAPMENSQNSLRRQLNPIPGILPACKGRPVSKKHTGLLFLLDCPGHYSH